MRTVRHIFGNAYRYGKSFVWMWMLGRQRHLKLHLGCGTEHLAGYINIDVKSNAAADLYLDFCRLHRVFSPESVAEAMMIHSLSYLNLWQARKLFKQLYVLLEPGGKVIIESPDLGKCAQRVLLKDQSLTDYLEGVRSIFAFDMSWVTNEVMYEPYAFGWPGWHLKQELEHVGFKEVLLLDPQTHGRLLWRDIRVEAFRS
jgi:hypothetical protein